MRAFLRAARPHERAPHAAHRVVLLRAEPGRGRQALQFPGARIRAPGLRRARHHATRSRESPHGRKTDDSLPLAGHRASLRRRRSKLPLAGKGLLQRMRQCRAAPPARARGLGILLGARRHAQGARSRAQSAAGRRHRHLAAACGAARRRAHRAATRLAADPRLPRSLERATTGRAGGAAALVAVVRAAHRGTARATQRGARAQHTRDARLVREILSARAGRAEFRDPEWLRRRRRRRAAPPTDRPDRHRARGRDLHRPLAGAGAARRGSALRARHPRAARSA